jgi:hypothetical protein
LHLGKAGLFFLPEDHHPPSPTVWATLSGLRLRRPVTSVQTGLTTPPLHLAWLRRKIADTRVAEVLCWCSSHTQISNPQSCFHPPHPPLLCILSSRLQRHTPTLRHTDTRTPAASIYQFRFGALQKFFHVSARNWDQGSGWRAPREESCGGLERDLQKVVALRRDQPLPRRAGRDWALLASSGRLAQPTPRGSSSSDSVLIRKVGVPPGSPGTATSLLARARLGGPDAGQLVGVARGSLANRRAPRWPPDAVRWKMLQPWTAPRSACQVPGRVCCSDTAAGLKAASSQQGKVGRGALAPGGGLVLGQRLSGWLALYWVPQWSLNELVCCPGPECTQGEWLELGGREGGINQGRAILLS